MSTFKAGDLVAFDRNFGDVKAQARGRVTFVSGSYAAVEDDGTNFDGFRFEEVGGVPQSALRAQTGSYRVLGYLKPKPDLVKGAKVTLKVTGKIDEDGDLDFGRDYVYAADLPEFEVPKVTVEVTGTVDANGIVRLKHGTALDRGDLAGDSIEVVKVEAPVEPFKAGDVLKGGGGLWLLGESSYRRIDASRSGEPYRAHPYGPRGIAGSFPADRYKRVTVEA